jgi:hypothetical protein
MGIWDFQQIYKQAEIKQEAHLSFSNDENIDGIDKVSAHLLSNQKNYVFKQKRPN